MRLVSLIAGLIALAFLSFHTVRTAVPLIESDLKVRAEQALLQAMIPFADVQIDGRDAILSGQAPNEAAKAKAIKLVGEVWGIASVTDRMSLALPPPPAVIEKPEAVGPSAASDAPPPTPLPAPEAALGAADGSSDYALQALFRAGTVTLSGAVPTPEEQAALLAYAREIFGDAKIIDQLAVREGMPDGAWPDVARLALKELAILTSGEMTLRGRVLMLKGAAAQPEEREAVRVAFDELPAIYSGSIDIAVAGGLQGDDALTIGGGPRGAAARACQERFDAVLASHQIRFAAGRAQIDAESVKLIGDLAVIAKDCPDARITIAGHTDSTSRLEVNERLSRQRAAAVRDALVAKGVPANRLSTEGHGPSRPIASNATEEGRARNRRIEFVVR
ncbi:MAG: OmpA family protein [Alphaproteobacteria bacterium]|nr:OmpA family protein [Alphaproteobacteria bacterium]